MSSPALYGRILRIILRNLLRFQSQTADLPQWRSCPRTPGFLGPFPSLFSLFRLVFNLFCALWERRNSAAALVRPFVAYLLLGSVSESSLLAPIPPGKGRGMNSLSWEEGGLIKSPASFLRALGTHFMIGGPGGGEGLVALQASPLCSARIH